MPDSSSNKSSTRQKTTNKTTQSTKRTSNGQTATRGKNPPKKRLTKEQIKQRKRRRLKRIIIFYITRGFVLLLPIFIAGFGIHKLVQHFQTASATPKTTSEATAEATTEAPMTPVTLTVSVVGDCTLGTDQNFNYNTSLNAFYYQYGKDYFLENVKDIFSADDLTIANFEGTLTTAETRAAKQFAFKAPPEFAQILTSGSVEAVTTANNHSHDYGDNSYTDTIAALDAQNIVNFGYEKTAVMDIKGVKVGLVGIYELRDHLGCSEQLKTNIAKVKSEGADLIIVIFHWGNELDAAPTEIQRTLGRLAVDEGADLVCGHHPHVVQGIEQYNGKNIVYSLGNFCFGGNSNPRDKDTMIFQQTFTVSSEGVAVDNVTNIIPCSISSTSSYNNYKPTPAQGTEYDRIMQKIQYRSSLIPAAQTQSSTQTESTAQTQSSTQAQPAAQTQSSTQAQSAAQTQY